MPITPRVVELANLFRARLLQQERLAAGAMARYYGTIWSELQGEMDALSREIRRLQAAGQSFSVDKIYRLERMQAVQNQVTEELDRFARYSGGAITAQQRQAIAMGERDAYQLTLSAFPPGAEINARFWRMPRDAVETMAGFVADGTPLAELIGGYVGESRDGFLERLVAGLAKGQNPRAIARELRDDFGMGLTKALEIARTEQLRAYRTATLGSYRESGVVKGWERHADKSDRTCIACIMLDGKLYELATDMDDHVNGRCCMLPVTKTYAEMGIDAPEPQFKQESAREWFERQDEATQRRMFDGISKDAYDSWKGGLFSLEDIPHVTRNDIWGDSWTEKPMYKLLGVEKRHSYTDIITDMMGANLESAFQEAGL